MTSFLVLPASLLTAAAGGQKPPRKPQAAPAAVTFEKHVRPLVMKYCAPCHTGAKSPSGLSLTDQKTSAQVLKARNLWERVSLNLSMGTMPPAGSPKPAPAEKERIIHWIDSTLSQADCEINDPGRVTLRRLNREEYNNTVRDLTGLDIRPADVFPSDDVGYGFDNIGDVLSISPLLMEKYLAAAERVAEAAIVTPESSAKPQRFEMESLPGAQKYNVETIAGHMFASNGELGADVDFPVPGEYVIRVQACAQQAGPEPARLAIRLDGKEMAVIDVRAPLRNPTRYEAKTEVAKGRRRVAVAFVNDFYQQEGERVRDRNLFVDWLEVQPPKGIPADLPESHRRIFLGGSLPQTEDSARRILSAFVRRAWRRPVRPGEVNRLLRYVRLARKEGESFERGIQLAVQAALVSPHFLFRVEVDPPAAASRAARLAPVNNWELASRLSYFLWSSMPDEELFSLAAKGALQKPEVLAAQAKRMLKDPKAGALVQNFGGQWLTLRNLQNVSPDPKRFPAFSAELRAAMRAETERFFEYVMRQDRSLLEFLDARYTFLNEALAKHYGIPGVTGSQFRRVQLADGRRGGVITQASILTLTSNPTRTSPVKRGKWVLEQLLGTPPPPPPGAVPELEDQKELKGTLRQQMEQHRENPSCASCHARMDPLGFGLENFDAVGAWRTRDGDAPIDSSGELPDGSRFNGPAELKRVLLAKKDQFIKAMADKMLTYAIGRGLETSDRCYVDEIAAKVKKADYRFTSLVTAVIQSDPFRKRRVEPARR